MNYSIQYKHRNGGTFIANDVGVPQTPQAMTEHALLCVNHSIMECCVLVNQYGTVLRIISERGHILVEA